MADSSSPDGGGATFNIGSQQAGSISNVGGDQRIGHLQATYVATPLEALADLRAAVDAAPLPPTAKQAAAQALDDAEAELAVPEPDRRRVADRLEKAAGILARVGALTAGAAQILTPLRELASWLGPAGSQLLQMLR